MNYNISHKSHVRSAITRLCLLVILSLAMSVKTTVCAQSESDSLVENFNEINDSLKPDTTGYKDDEDYEDEDTAKVYFNEKSYMAQPYTTSKLMPHANSDSTVERLKKEEDFWYITTVEKIKADAVRIKTDKRYRDSLISAGTIQPNEQVDIKNQNYDISFQPWMKWVLWAVIIGIFLFAVVYFLAANQISFFTRRGAKSGNTEVSENDINIFQLPYSDLLKKAYTEKNYRLAVRILYLQTLKMLSEKQLINFQPDFTNLHYLGQLAQTSYYNDFFTITRHYEYVWYGEFSVPEPVFEKIKTDFLTIQSKMPRL